MKYLFPLIMAFFLLPLSACQTIPKDAFQLSATSLQDRQLQTRKFETEDEMALLSAGVGVLQDMGYTLEATEKDIGLITASKMADATNGLQIGLSILAALAGTQPQAIDKEQKIRVAFVTHPSRDKGSFLARITFQRVVWNTRGVVSRVETLKEADLYEGFFDKLSKSVFLEGYKI